MSKNIPAFPSGGYCNDCMTLRDYFAAHAPDMPKYFSENWCAKEAAKSRKDDIYQQRGEVFAIAEWNYVYADAMLEAREK